MKQMFFFLLAASISGCDKQKQELVTSVTELYDVTDTRLVKPSDNVVLTLFHMEDAIEKEAWFRVTTITDMELNPAEEIHLKPASQTEKDNSNDDPYFRQKLVMEFYNSISAAISKICEPKDTVLRMAYGYSQIFKSIAHELTLLANRKSDAAFLLVHSDLLENSQITSVYSDPVIDTVAIRNVFENEESLPGNLSNIQVIFVFQPKNKEESETFILLADIYRKMLEKRAAKVSIYTGNNQIQAQNE